MAYLLGGQAGIMLGEMPTSKAPAPRTTLPSSRVLLTALRPSLMASFICSPAAAHHQLYKANRESSSHDMAYLNSVKEDWLDSKADCGKDPAL